MTKGKTAERKRTSEQDGRALNTAKEQEKILGGRLWEEGWEKNAYFLALTSADDT